jgi:hypothetical protein
MYKIRKYLLSLFGVDVYKKFKNLGLINLLKLNIYKFLNLNYVILKIPFKNSFTKIKIRTKDESDLAAINGYLKEEWINDFSELSISKNVKYYFFDLGANIGLTSLCFSQKFENVDYIIVELDLDWLKKIDFFYIETHAFSSLEFDRLNSIFKSYSFGLIKNYDYWNYTGWCASLYGQNIE